MDKRYMAIGTSMLVLKLLEEEPLYGYQMIRLMESAVSLLRNKHKFGEPYYWMSFS